MGLHGDNLHRTLLDGVSSTDNGTWVDVTGLTKTTVHIIISATATVTINGSNAKSQPDPSEAGIVLGTYTASDLVSIDAPIGWIKAAVTVHSSGTVDAELEGAEG